MYHTMEHSVIKHDVVWEVFSFFGLDSLKNEKYLSFVRHPDLLLLYQEDRYNKFYLKDKNL